mmetsp:Transcript_38310/g.83690  ORF Transcript_38310/g.83690 Transcript_38310/m.83690 type:complete len:355 (-) Transcript_38310:111-1175(-)
MGTCVVALLEGRQLGPICFTLRHILVVAPHLPGLLPLAALHAALGPGCRHPGIAPIQVLALLDRGGLGLEGALVVLPSAADDLPGLGGLPTLHPALAPPMDDPLRLRRLELLSHRVVRGQRGQRHRLGAAIGLFAHHVAVRLPTCLWALALPVALGLLADILALNLLVVALQGALRLRALGGALGAGGPTARAVGRTARLLTTHHTVIVGGLGAPRLTLGELALGGAVLLADWVGAVPGASRVAMLIVDQGVLLVVPVVVVGLLHLVGPGVGVLVGAVVVVAPSGGQEGHRRGLLSPGRELRQHPPILRVKVVHLVPHSNRHPNVPSRGKRVVYSGHQGSTGSGPDQGATHHCG